MKKFFRGTKLTPKLNFHKLQFSLLKFKYWLKRLLPLLIILPLTILLYIFFTLPVPVISVQIPEINQTVTEKELYIQGKIKPIWAQITVNGQGVSINGDGKFTLILPLKIGNNILKFQAYNFGKKAEYILPITRNLSNEEKLAEAEAKQKEEAEARQRVLAADTKIGDLIEKSTHDSLIYIVQIVSSVIKKDSVFSRIEGVVNNMTLDPVYWVKITAKFYNASDQLIDTKEGLAVAEADAIAPGKTHEFTTQATDKDFAYYKLSVDWTTSQFSSTTSATFDTRNFPTPQLSPAAPRQNR